MRGLGRDMSIGQRVAWYRHRRGLSQEVLAGMVGRTTDWLSKVENGRANLDRLSVIKALADALDVTIGDLLGDPALVDWAQGSNTRTVTLLRDPYWSTRR
jgi:transcriptional regulator with XRE-family HTH domain